LAADSACRVRVAISARSFSASVAKAGRRSNSPLAPQ
jgi:hypothetical protein